MRKDPFGCLFYRLVVNEDVWSGLYKRLENKGSQPEKLFLTEQSVVSSL